MIVVFLQGGLGNQLFQYAFGRFLALTNSTELFLDTQWFVNTPPGDTVRDLDICNYAINAHIADQRQRNEWRFCRSRFSKILTLTGSLHVIRDPGRVLHHHLIAKDDSYLYGFWQSEKYFKSIRNILIQEFKPHAVLPNSLVSLSNEIMTSQSVSLHIRRGDYVTSSAASAFHGTCPISYYLDAIEYISRHILNPVFYVFTDDVAWAKKNLVAHYPVCYVADYARSTSWHDLWLLSLCRCHIIANSSFSWWGAWLSAQSDKIVVAPRHWFAARALPPDLLPASWIKL